MPKKVKEYETYKVEITQSAVNDLKEIISFISKNNPKTALLILDKIQKKIKTLDHFPYRGSYVPELLSKNIKDYRQLTEEPWKIIYRVDNDIVNVLVIVDSRRNLQDILIRKFVK